MGNVKNQIAFVCQFLIAIFGSKLDMVLERKKYYLLQILFNAAQKALTLRCPQKEPPTDEEWMSIIRRIYIMENKTVLLD